MLFTGVYSTEDDSCSTNELNRLILRVGESCVSKIYLFMYQDVEKNHFSVAIFPDDARAMTMADGSLPIMSYWYGKVSKIYLKPRGETHVSVFKMQMI
jgi:hypothetical protein